MQEERRSECARVRPICICFTVQSPPSRNDGPYIIYTTGGTHAKRTSVCLHAARYRGQLTVIAGRAVLRRCAPRRSRKRHSFDGLAASDERQRRLFRDGLVFLQEAAGSSIYPDTGGEDALRNFYRSPSRYTDCRYCNVNPNQLGQLDV